MTYFTTTENNMPYSNVYIFSNNFVYYFNTKLSKKRHKLFPINISKYIKLFAKPVEEKLS